jgi:beta-galactosidase
MDARFPNNFLWGAATSAFQIEGAAAQHGKAPSIWDDFCATPDRVAGSATGNVTCDHYHLWRQDVDLLRQLNLHAYRFSVSWPRVLPQGRGTVNETGLAFYSRLVDALLEAGIQPCVTAYHWDLPAALQAELGGWAHPDLPRLFADYAGLLYDRLGDRVRLWITINEPWCVAVNGYIQACHPPGVHDEPLGYRVGHNLLRAHAYAAARYRSARHNHGAVGLALNTTFSYPATDSPADHAAAERAMLGFGGWFGDPVVMGDYPEVLRVRLGDQLPAFSEDDSRLLQDSSDFIGLNYYTSDCVRHAPRQGPLETEILKQPDRPHTTMGWPIVPDGLRRLLLWLHDRYPGKPIYITENGAAFDDKVGPDGRVDDQPRIDYLRDHIAAAAAARAAGVELRGYFVWSLLDNLEWAEGFSKRFGLIRCDFATRKRTIKASGRWYANWIADLHPGGQTAPGNRTPRATP